MGLLTPDRPGDYRLGRQHDGWRKSRMKTTGVDFEQAAKGGGRQRGDWRDPGRTGQPRYPGGDSDWRDPGQRPDALRTAECRQALARTTQGVQRDL